MILTRLEKEQFVLDLHNQGKGTRTVKELLNREKLDKDKQKEHLFQHKHTNSFPKDGQRFKSLLI